MYDGTMIDAALDMKLLTTFSTDENLSLHTIFGPVGCRRSMMMKIARLDAV